MRSSEMFETRTKSSKKEQRENRRQNVISLLVCVFASFALATCSLRLAEANVVRPTKFKGDTEEPSGVLQQLQRSASGPQPASSPTNQQGQAATAAASAIPAPELGAQASQSTKINPLKSAFCLAQNGLRLDGPLGLQSLQVDHLALSASSRSNELVGPQFARLNLDFSGGAWCPERPISPSNFGKEWIQVKLNRSYVVSAIETQGRYYSGNGKEFVPSYHVEYSRNGGLTWHKWKDFHGLSLLRGNEDVNSAVKNELSPPIVGANVIRILPYSAHLRTVCLRFELHGCPYDEGAPVSYETNDGVVEPRWGHLIDYTYDGLKLAAVANQLPAGSGNHLSRGLGQLVDGVRGLDNFAHNSGLEWVGWKSMNGDVIIEFTFRTLRNFSGALFHSNNMFSSGVEVFQAVDVHYGIDVALSMEAVRDSLWERERRLNPTSGHFQRAAGVRPEGLGESQTLWSSEVNNIEYEPDKKVEASRPVTVHLKGRLANKLRFVLKFASKWILISEVEFISSPVEFLSLASANQEQTPPLMAALQPAKTYDEFLAILRENDLRREVTRGLLRQPSSGGKPAGSDPADFLEGGSTDSSDIGLLGTGRQVTGPAIPQSPSKFWPAPSSQAPPAADFEQPAIDYNIQRILEQQQLGSSGKIPASDTFTGNDFLRILGDNNGNRQVMAGEPSLEQTSQSSPASAGRQLGLATVISLVFVSLLLFLGFVLALSSYRLRCKHPKLGTPRLPHQHQHLMSGGGGGAGGSHNKPFRNFMSVFSSSSASSSSGSSSTASALTSQLRGAASSNGNSPADYIFANPSNVITGNTLKKLQLSATSKRPHNFLAQAHQHQNSPANLLVSVKEPHGSSSHHRLAGQSHNLFAFGSQTTKPQSINTQLILGLNQANPLAQQQIYNNLNYSTAQTYSMSMASSSTNGNQADYGDYAIPDLPTIVAPLVPHQAQPQLAQMNQLNQFQLQAHQMNLNSSTFNPQNANNHNDSFQFTTTNRQQNINAFNNHISMDSGG